MPSTTPDFRTATERDFCASGSPRFASRDIGSTFASGCGSRAAGPFGFASAGHIASKFAPGRAGGGGGTDTGDRQPAIGSRFSAVFAAMAGDGTGVGLANAGRSLAGFTAGPAGRGGDSEISSSSRASGMSGLRSLGASSNFASNGLAAGPGTGSNATGAGLAGNGARP